MSKKLALVLGAGGSRGVAHIGFLQALEEAGITPFCLTGSSMGAVVGGCYASGKSPAEMREIALKIKKSDLIDPSIRPLSQMALLRSKKLSDVLVKLLDGEKIENFKIPFACVATDLYSGESYVFREGDAALAIQASCTIPAVFRPVRADGRFFVDGGVLVRLPIREAKEMGAEVIVAVDVLKNASLPVDDVHNILSVIMRTFDVMDANNTKRLLEQYSDICDLLIQPEMNGINQYAIKQLDRAYAEGYAAGLKNIDKIRKLIED